MNLLSNFVRKQMDELITFIDENKEAVAALVTTEIVQDDERLKDIDLDGKLFLALAFMMRDQMEGNKNFSELAAFGAAVRLKGDTKRGWNDVIAIRDSMRDPEATVESTFTTITQSTNTVQ